MEKLKKLRTQVRTKFTKLIKEIEKLLLANETDLDKLSTGLDRLESKQVELSSLDKNILEHLSEDQACQPDSSNLEYECIDKYNTNYLEIKNKLSHPISKLEKGQIQETSLSLDAMATRRKFKPPKQELKPFNGEIRNFLSFWGQFEKIHEDQDVVNEDKMQYLIQIIQKGSRAREIVDSFPPTADTAYRI